jgi:hypothetical protein
MLKCVCVCVGQALPSGVDVDFGSLTNSPADLAKAREAAKAAGVPGKADGGARTETRCVWELRMTGD